MSSTINKTCSKWIWEYYVWCLAIIKFKIIQLLFDVQRSMSHPTFIVRSNSCSNIIPISCTFQYQNNKTFIYFMFKALFQIHVNLRNIIMTHDDNRNQDQNIVFHYRLFLHSWTTSQSYGIHEGNWNTLVLFQFEFSSKSDFEFNFSRKNLCSWTLSRISRQ